jgi:ABC-type uncharacterized transport system permease subunit
MRLPRLKLERVLVLTGRDAVKISAASIIVAFVIFSIFLLLEGADAIEAYKNIFSFAFNPRLGLVTTIHRSMFLLLVTLAFILPLKTGFWNVGVQGQFYLGTVGAFAVAYALGNLPAGVLIPLMMVAASLFGAGYGAIAGFLKEKWGVNEVVLTIMLNNIAFWLIYCLVIGGPWMGISESESRSLPASAMAPTIGKIPFTVPLAIALSVIFYFLLTKSSIGYQIRCYGSNPSAAKYAGMNPLKLLIFVTAIGGAIAGLSAYHMWAGDPSFGRIPRPEGYMGIGDFTFWGIIVGLVCLLNPIAAIPASIFIGSLREGGAILVRRLGLTFGLDNVFVGILFLTFVAFQFFHRYKIIRVKKRG